VRIRKQEVFVEAQQIIQDVASKGILFPNSNHAKAVTVPIGKPVDEILKALGIPYPKPLILLVGAAGHLDERLRPRLTQLFSRGIARAVARVDALIIDGGTQAGVMALMGQAVADRERKTVLLGIVPSSKVTYPGGPAEGSIEDGAALDPNHSHFVLVEGDEWGAETETMFTLARAISKDRPVVTILAGGGDVALKEILLSVREGWPVTVIEGSGGLADKIFHLWRKKRRKSFSIDSPELAEIIAEGKIQFFSLKGNPEDLKSLLHYHLPIHFNSILKLAWEDFSLYDSNAIRQQGTFNQLQRIILILGVTGTLLALTQAQLRMLKILNDNSWQGHLLHVSIIIIPILVTMLIAVTNRFKAGNKWILLRAAAEAVKRAIYGFRARVNLSNDPQPPLGSLEERLVSDIEKISSNLMQTEVNHSALYPYSGFIPPRMYGAGTSDDGYSDLTPSQYITIRLGDQLNYYRLKTAKLDRQLLRLQWLIYTFGAAGTLLAALGAELWIAMTTSLVGALTAFLEYQQVESTLMKYNQAATDLTNIKSWWTALPDEAKRGQKNIDSLVTHTETVLQTELSGWAQQMESAISRLKEEQAAELEKKPLENQSVLKK
jgi:hypothetical protein